MSVFHQMQFAIFLVAVVLSRMQSMITLPDDLFGEDVIVGWNNRKLLKMIPVNMVAINVLFYGLYFFIILFAWFVDYLGGL